MGELDDKPWKVASEYHGIADFVGKSVYGRQAWHTQSYLVMFKIKQYKLSDYGIQTY